MTHVIGYVAIGFAIGLLVGAAHAAALLGNALIVRHARWMDGPRERTGAR